MIEKICLAVKYHDKFDAKAISLTKRYTQALDDEDQEETLFLTNLYEMPINRHDF